jgi:phosphoribosyl-ATP pyrophosphohydrolase
MSDPIRRLYEAVLVARGEDPAESRTAKLFRDGRIKIAKKLVEEAAEVALESSVEDRDAVIRESVDLLYNLVVLWASNGIAPSEIWHEMADREEQLGMAEKLPKS